MNPDDLSDEQILYIVGQTDAELFRDGVDIKNRYWKVPKLVMQKLGFISYVFAGIGKPKLFERIELAFNSIYRHQDLAIGGQIGVFMYRDIFARVAVPIGFGTFRLNPFDHVELTPTQLRIIQTEPEEIEIFFDQFSDLADIQYGTDELKAPFFNTELITRFLGLSRLHLHAAAAVLTGGYDYRGAVQSALLATELALKSGAAAQGLSEIEIKKRFGHDLIALTNFVAKNFPLFDSSRMTRVINKQPNYVRNRYASTQPKRRDVGHLVMGAQYLVSEVVRQLSNRNFRDCLQPPMARRYPA